MTAKNVTDGSEASSIEFWVRNAGGSSYKMMDINTTVDSTITVVGHMDVNGKLSADRWIFLNAIYPETAGDATIGTETNEWGDLYLHEDKAIKFGSTQNATITHGSGGLTHEAANMVFKTNEGGAIKQVMDINVETDNVITIGTPTNLTGLKVYGTLTISETAFEKDLIPAVDGGGLHEAGLGSPTRRWDDLHIYDEGFASFGGDNIAAVTLTHDDGTGDAKPGLILDTDSKFYFDNVNTYIGIETDDSGILEVVSDNEVEIDGGLLLDLDGAAVTINASGASANIALTTNSGKVTLETGTAGTLSHKSDADGEDFTIEQIDAGVARNSSLFINSAGTGEDAIAVTASAGGIDIIAEGSTGPIDITAEEVVIFITSSAVISIGPVEPSAIISIPPALAVTAIASSPVPAELINNEEFLATPASICSIVKSSSSASDLCEKVPAVPVSRVTLPELVVSAILADAPLALIVTAAPSRSNNKPPSISTSLSETTSSIPESSVSIPIYVLTLSK
jgi:hypothetical protein